MVMISQINGIVKNNRNLKERLNVGYTVKWASVVQMVKNLAAIHETGVPSLGQEDPLKKVMATHSSILAWLILWTEVCGHIVSQRVRHN